MAKHVLWSTCTVFLAALRAHAGAQAAYKSVADGIIINSPQKSTHETPLLGMRVISDKILRVTTVSKNDFHLIQILTAMDRSSQSVNWNMVQKGNQVLLPKSSVIAQIRLLDKMIFNDKIDKLILSKNAEPSFAFTSNNIESPCHITQTFKSLAKKVIYDLGQQQNRIVNFINQYLKLLRNTIEAAAPFLTFSKNHSILLGNYPLIKFDDTRDYQSLSGLNYSLMMRNKPNLLHLELNNNHQI
ncbi:hypothetical protein [Mucilaginibacter sp. SG564]|uniref:hypothetical protein n=1 Tax=unclassified Mucilaginibacter TaxID=2617802 RepID=UPI001557D6B2|nr:hypothetical protein [Mucilaginibacter sp. SG564]NOW97875.1 hypothetical protein [Mucilaginibacter sp. SG564]